MSGGLVLRLRPHEKFLVNGVVIENGGRRARLRVKTQEANILRIREALHPDDATTPAKRLYYIAQLGVVGEAGRDETQSALQSGLADLKKAFGETFCCEDIDSARELASAGEFYRVMRALARIIPHEAVLLGATTASSGDRALSDGR